MYRKLVPFLWCAWAVGCARPVPASQEEFVGVWTGTDMSVSITAEGRLDSRRKSAGFTVELGGSIRAIETDYIRVGIWPISSTFHVDRLPHVEGGRWKMTIDGVELSRDDSGGSLALGSDVAPRAQLACDAGDAQICSHLGETYLSGNGVEKDVHAAATALGKACDGKIARACFNLATLYQDGSLPQDPKRAAELNQRACDRSDADACHNLALAYQQGTGVTKDLSKTLDLLQKACSIDPVVSCSYLGGLYDAGEVVAQDEPRAIELFHRACGVGEPNGCYNFAVKLMMGEALVRDSTLAARLFEKVCNTDVTNGEGATAKHLSCHNLGALYASGDGVPKSEERALALFTKACDLGDATSCHNLGVAYSLVEGATHDLPKAIQLFEKACAAGMAASCTNLGNFYLEGKGVKLDRQQAVELFKKACSGGSEKGCSRLADLKGATPI